MREDFFLKEVKINIFQIMSKSDKFFSNLTFHGRDRVETLLEQAHHGDLQNVSLAVKSLSAR